MSYYMKLDFATGEILGWYDSVGVKQENIHDLCREVTHKKWQEALDIGATHYINGQFVRKERELSEEEKLEMLRRKRDKALSEVDVYQGVLRYEELTSSQKEELGEYRKALLDAPQNMVLPDKPVWMK